MSPFTIKFFSQIFHIMKTRSLNFGIDELTYDDAKIWNQCYFDFILKELSLAKSKRKAILKSQKVI